MINKLQIKNFQSHRKSTLEFDSGVNVIVGPSDSGKTAIIRSLRWLFWNRPTSDSFRSWWEGETKVDITTKDNRHFYRSKDKENHYHYNGTTFSAFGTDVPEEIQRALNINEINLQSQLDSPFLIKASPGEVASHFNHIAHLDEIDSSLKHINSKIRSIDSTISSDSTRKEKLEEEIKQYDYLEKFEIRLEVLEGEREKLIQKVQGKNSLEKITTLIAEIETDIAWESPLLFLENQVDVILNLLVKFKEKEEKQYELNTDITNILTVEYDIINQSYLLQFEHMVTVLLRKSEKVEELEIQQTDLAELIEQINRAGIRLDKYKEFLIRQEERFCEEMPDVCPLCQHKYKKS